MSFEPFDEEELAKLAASPPSKVVGRLLANVDMLRSVFRDATIEAMRCRSERDAAVARATGAETERDALGRVAEERRDRAKRAELRAEAAEHKLCEAMRALQADSSASARRALARLCGDKP